MEGFIFYFCYYYCHSGLSNDDERRIQEKSFSPYHHHDHHCHRIANMIIMMIASIVVMITAISSSSPVVSIKHEAFAIIFFLECDLEEEKRWRWWNNWSRIKVAKFQSDLPLILSLCSAPQNTFILLILASSALLSSFLLLQSNQINSLQSTHLQHKYSSNNKNQIRRHGLLLPYTPLPALTLWSWSYSKQEVWKKKTCPIQEFQLDLLFAIFFK